MSVSISAAIVVYKACIANAEQLVLGARALLERDDLPRLSYHLAVLALEEIGKSKIIAMQIVSEQCGRELPSSIRAGMDDHIKKLFWAIWGPSMAHETITPQQFQSNIGLATKLHEKRIRGLYVDPSDSGEISLPDDFITTDEATDLLTFADASLNLAKAETIDETKVSPSAVEERQLWFFEATDDPERRNMVMGRKSMEKLKELGSVPQWVDWLKKTFEDADTEAKAAIDQELQRQPDDFKNAIPKWRITLRIHSLSHSIRQKPLNELNDGLTWIKLRHVSGKPDQLQVDIDARSDIGLDHVWKSSLVMSRRLVMALNVATLGYFWFHEPLDSDPKQSGRFYEKILNLESKTEVRAHRNPGLRLDFGSHRRVLDRAELNRWTLCFGILLRYHKSPELEMCERYLDGLTMIAKSDSHMAFEIQSVAAFYMALKHAMKLYGAWGDEPFPDALRRFATEAVKSADEAHIDRLIAVGESVNTGVPVQHAMNMNDVGVMKALCDIFLVRTFQRLGPGDNRRTADENLKPTN